MGETAFYLGNHWGYMRAIGEPQLTFNYARAIVDFKNNFCFSKGVHWTVPKENEAIIPAVLERIWTHDNHKEHITWECGQMGGICGDVFVKVAYEEAWVDPAGNAHPGKVRILPLNPSFCLPVDENEVLTQRGWLKADDLTTEDKVLSIDPATNKRVWADVEAINIFDWDGPVYDWRGKNFTATMTPDHRWMVKDYAGRNQMRRSEDLHGLSGARLVLAGGEAGHFPTEPTYSDAFVELVGWFATEGWWSGGSDAIEIGQSTEANPGCCDQLDLLAKHFRSEGYDLSSSMRSNGVKHWYFPALLGKQVRSVVGPEREISPEFLTALTEEQAELLYATILAGDGDKTRERLYQTNSGLVDSFQMLAMLLGKRSTATKRPRSEGRDKFGNFDGTVDIHQSKVAWLGHMDRTERHYKGRMWCPTTSTGTWVTRRIEGGDASQTQGMSKTMVFLTGNCFPEW